MLHSRTVLYACIGVAVLVIVLALGAVFFAPYTKTAVAPLPIRPPPPDLDLIEIYHQRDIAIRHAMANPRITRYLPVDATPDDHYHVEFLFPIPRDIMGEENIRFSSAAEVAGDIRIGPYELIADPDEGGVLLILTPWPNPGTPVIRIEGFVEDRMTGVRYPYNRFVPYALVVPILPPGIPVPSPKEGEEEPGDSPVLDESSLLHATEESPLSETSIMVDESSEATPADETDASSEPTSSPTGSTY